MKKSRKTYNTPNRRAGKKRYYIKHRKYNGNNNTRWMPWECAMLLQHNIPDVQLSKILSRSLAALHVKRVRLVKSIYGVSV